MKAKETGKDYVIVAWDSPESDGGSPLTGFVVERKDVTKTSWVGAGECDAQTFHFKVTKLIEGNEYEFQIAAVNDVGQSDWANLGKPVKAKLGFGKSLPFPTCVFFSYVFFCLICSIRLLQWFFWAVATAKGMGGQIILTTYLSSEKQKSRCNLQ